MVKAVMQRGEKMNIEQEKMIVEALPSLYPLHKHEEDAIRVVLDAIPHWIPVTEATLPEENRVVVVCGDKGTWDFGTYRGHGDNIHFWHWKKNTYKRVYWWMYKEDALPLPTRG